MTHDPSVLGRIEDGVLEELIYRYVRRCVNPPAMLSFQQELAESIGLALASSTQTGDAHALARRYLQAAWARVFEDVMAALGQPGDGSAEEGECPFCLSL